MPGGAGDGQQVRAAVLGGGVEQLLAQAQVVVAAGERRVEAGGTALAAAVGDDARGRPQAQRLGLALELERAHRVGRDRGLGCAARCLVDEHGARPGGALDAGGGVDDVAGDHPLADGADRDRGLAGGDAGPGRELEPRLGAQVAHRGDQLERRPHRALGVVLVRRPASPRRRPRRRR